ncbi:potassium/proton antiporter [Streptobacillus moniliformis]|uniref:potassium/proton antiporter n=1 Tax=Streptobacillus moniliformis TaxID=34105 RepID=UPI0007E307D7|nr:potassium/proton antiporter [Streptobacillus moniliformis]
MVHILLFFSVVLIACVFVYKYLSKFGLPMLLVFIGLGMIFGENGIFRINFDNFLLSKDICSLALVFIIFFGGFNTKLSMARPVLKKSLILSSLGVLFTAFLTAIFTHFILKLDWKTSLLTGAVLSSTDAASVFSILKSYKLNLKEHTASLLEIESGSNDPFAYVLTIAFISASDGFLNLPILLLKQIIYGVSIGFIVAKLTIFLLKKIKNLDIGFTMAFLMGTTLLSYAFSETLGGNGYISIYLFGIIVGNSKFKGKSEIISFFDGITSIMQMVIFFLLGLLVSPAIAFKYILPSIILMLAITFVIRPLVIGGLLIPLKSSREQIILVSWAGLKGAASVVFSILVVVSNKEIGYLIFNMSFIIVLLSIAFQGSLIPYVAKKLDMIDETENVLKTFNDYSDEEDVDFISFEIDKNHKWVGMSIKNIEFTPGVLLVLIIRNGENIVPDGNTKIRSGDKMVLCGSTFEDKNTRINIYEKFIDKNSSLYHKYIYELDKKMFVVMIKRNNKSMIPNGNTIIKENDTLVIVDR